MNIIDEKDKRTFIEFKRKNDGTLKKIGRYKGSNPSQAARKAIMKESKRTGQIDNINIILHEPGKLNRFGKEEIRLYTGFIKDEKVIDPKMGKHQRKSAIKHESWVLDESGNPQTVFDDGYDSTQDPILQGKRPVYIAKRAVSSYLGTENMVTDKKIFIELKRKDDGTLEKVGNHKGNTPSQAACRAIMKESKRTGEVHNIEIILYEPGELNKKDEERTRSYTGFIKDIEFVDPKMGEHQRKFAIDHESWVLDESGNPQTVFDDGYDSTQDPILQGKRPLYIAKRAVSFLHGGKKWRAYMKERNIKIE